VLRRHSRELYWSQDQDDGVGSHTIAATVAYQGLQALVMEASSDEKPDIVTEVVVLAQWQCT
jgi:hypothetical protein